MRTPKAELFIYTSGKVHCEKRSLFASPYTTSIHMILGLDLHPFALTCNYIPLLLGAFSMIGSTGSNHLKFTLYLVRFLRPSFNLLTVNLSIPNLSCIYLNILFSTLLNPCTCTSFLVKHVYFLYCQVW